MRFLTVLLLFFISILLVVSVLSSFFIFSSSNDLMADQYKDYVSVILENKFDTLDLFFTEKTSDISVMIQSPYIINFFEEQVLIQSESAKKDIKIISETVSDEVNDYLLAHPKTIVQLQDDPVFQSIAVQPVGKTGYTALTDYDDLISRFHATSSIVDLDLHLLADKLPEFWGVMRQSEGGVVSEGFYDWQEADGSIRQKYMYINPVESKTLDGVGLTVATTTYVGEYADSFKPLCDLEDYMGVMKVNYAYADIALLGLEGDILWDYKNSSLAGQNIFDSSHPQTHMQELFYLLKKNKNVQFTDLLGCKSIIDSCELLSGSPVKNIKGDIIGYVLLTLDHKQIQNIFIDPEKDDIVNTYLIGFDNMSKSFIEGDKNLEFVSEIANTPLSDECFIHKTFSPGELEIHNALVHSKLTPSYNFEGDAILGSSIYLYDLDWCLIGELDADAVVKPIQNKFLFLAFVNIGSIFILLIFGSFILSRYMTKDISRLTKTVNQISKGDLDTRVSDSNIYEVHKLIISLRRILTSLKLAVLKVGVRKEELHMGAVIKAKEEAEHMTKKREEELQRFAKLAIGREHVMIFLKSENIKLKKKLGIKVVPRKKIDVEAVLKNRLTKSVKKPVKVPVKNKSILPKKSAQAKKKTTKKVAKTKSKAKTSSAVRAKPKQGVAKKKTANKTKSTARSKAKTTIKKKLSSKRSKSKKR